MIQALLAIMTLAAFVLATSPSARLRRFAPVVGIPAQAMWAISIDWTAQWGIALVVVVYLARYLQLAWRAWVPTLWR